MDSDIVTGISSTAQLERKMHLKGKILKTNKAGAIVDIGVEKPALLHVSQIILDEGAQSLRVEDFLQEGQEVDVYVRAIKGDRVEVSMKKPLALEWREINKDMVVTGKVTALERFGAFIEIGAERPGLVHISELTHGFVRDASEIVKIGDEVEAKVIDFNRRKKQIKLSMKAMQPGLDEIEGVTITPARPKRKGKKKGKSAEKAKAEKINEEQEPTVMEIALRQAMEKSENGNLPEETRIKKGKHVSEVQDDILSRTLSQRS